MKERGKAVEMSNSNNNFLPDFNFFASSSEMRCEKHPNTSPVGICPHCLKDRLVKLVCSECGEQRLSSCSCSDVSSSYRNSCSTMEVGSVGRVSFLIENDKISSDAPHHRLSKTREDSNSSDHNRPVIFLRRSSSSCVEVKKSNGFWRIKRLFRKMKKRVKGDEEDMCDEKSEIWVSDIMGVSRSRSLCSFRERERVGYSDGDEGSETYRLSSAKMSDVTSGIVVDQMSESESRKSDFSFRGGGKRGVHDQVGRVHVFPAKECDFSRMDESGFIDLKLDMLSEITEGSRVGESENRGGGGVKEGTTKTRKVWKWICKYHHHHHHHPPNTKS